MLSCALTALCYRQQGEVAEADEACMQTLDDTPSQGVDTELGLPDNSVGNTFLDQSSQFQSESGQSYLSETKLEMLSVFASNVSLTQYNCGWVDRWITNVTAILLDIGRQ